MIRASRAREMMDSASRYLYEKSVESIHQGVIERLEEGYTYMRCQVPPDLFERYGDELMKLLKKSGYHVSEPSNNHQLTSFIISWKKDSPFIEDQSERPKWWQFWK